MRALYSAIPSALEGKLVNADAFSMVLFTADESITINLSLNGSR